MENANSRLRMDSDKQEAFLEIMDSPGLPVLLSQLELCVQAMEADVLRFSLSPETEHAFLFLKAKAEGARKLNSSFLSHIAKLKKAPSE